MRIGIGHDVHQLVPERRLIIGGVAIPFDRGLLGHSDADVLLHAVCDALLGAAGLGDIGRHFPDSDPAYKDIDSMRLLREQMIRNIASALGVAGECVNLKATTTEGLGYIGRGEGIAAACAVLLEAAGS